MQKEKRGGYFVCMRFEVPHFRSLLVQIHKVGAGRVRYNTHN